MIRLITTVLLLQLVQVFSFAQESIEKRVSLADAVIEGKVVEKQSFWNEKHTSIYTVNKVKIHKVFKGVPDTEYLTIVTDGGIVANDFQIIPHSHQVGELQEGIFFLERVVSGGHFEMAYLEKPQIIYRIENGLFLAEDGGQFFTNPKNLYSKIQIATGRNYIPISDNTIEESIAEWLEETLAIVNETDILIEFTFENIELIGSDKVAFDIMAKSNQDGIRFAASDVYINYNTDAFGINVVQNEKIEASKETVIENEVYTLELTDETSSVVKFLVDAEIVPNELYYLSQVAEKFLHVEIDIDNIIELATISFDGFLMSNQSFFYDEISGGFVGFDKVAVDDPFSAFLIPQIGGISPNPVPAGTRLDEHILVITKREEPGNGFGNHNNPDGTFNQNCTECRVRFVDSDNPFGHVYARGADIISWTDEEIRLNIPSATAVSGFYQNSAASGGMRVESPTGNSSEVDIHISYSVLNFQSSASVINPSRRFASELQTPEGIVFNYHQNVIAQGKKEETNRAIVTWCNATNIGWKVSDVVLQDNNIEELLNGSDDRNIISVQPDSEFSSPVARAFVKITGHFNTCNSNQVFYISDVDVALNDDNIQFNDADNWYNYILHELGHAHLLYHSINPEGGTLDEYIMNFDVTLINNIGSSNGNLHRHPIQSDDNEGANTIFSSSANLLSQCSEITPMMPIGCTGVNNTQTIQALITDFTVYPNPNFGQEIILSLTLKERLDFKVDLFDIMNSHVASFQPSEGVVGKNLIPLSLPNNLPQGSYIIGV